MAEDGGAATRRLMALLAERGGTPVDLPILYPLATFTELAGEDFRRRLFTTMDADGEELALRPDFTIPVALHHLATADGPARYAYMGPVFRQRRAAGPAEFAQAGVEWIGAGGGAADDTAVLALALEVAGTGGLPAPRLRVGDQDIFRAVVARLALPERLAHRLVRAFGNPERLSGLIAALGGGEAGPSSRVEGLAAALSRLEPAEARRVVAAVVELSSGSPFGGRTPEEIADRILSRADRGTDGNAAAARVLSDYLAVDCPLAETPERLAAFARAAGIDLSAETARIAAFVDALAGEGIAVGEARFEAAFGRRLDYYTGFVFELMDPARPDAGHVIGGGRYDRLLALLGAASPVPAVGFSVWLDRLAPGERP